MIDPYFALLLSIPVGLVLILSQRPSLACASLLIGAQLLLPERVGWDPPFLPPLWKESIPGLLAIALCLWRYPGRMLSAPGPRWPEAVLAILFASAFGTALTNGDPILWESIVHGWHQISLPPLQIYDGFTMGLDDLIRYGIPFLIGRAFFRTREEIRTLLVVLVVAGLAYSLFIVLEARMSPQMNRWVYGFEGQWFTVKRMGGWRPKVFMNNGLELSMFILAAMIASWTLLRARFRIASLPAGPVAGYLTGILLLCRSLGSILYGATGLAACLWMRPRTQLRIALVLSALALSYPALRIARVVPTDLMVSAASEVSEERAASLQFRFSMEHQLLGRALERAAFGWGGYDRSHIYYYDNADGRTRKDGYWVGLVGERGLLGYGGFFLLLLGPVVSASRNLHRSRDRRLVTLGSGLAVIVALTGIDLLPNGLFMNLPFLYSGALLGVSQEAARRRGPPRANSTTERSRPDPDQRRGLAGPLAPKTPAASPRA